MQIDATSGKQYSTLARTSGEKESTTGSTASHSADWGYRPFACLMGPQAGAETQVAMSSRKGAGAEG